MRSEGLRKTPRAMLSRAVAGVRGRTSSSTCREARRPSGKTRRLRRHSPRRRKDTGQSVSEGVCTMKGTSPILSPSWPVSSSFLSPCVLPLVPAYGLFHHGPVLGRTEILPRLSKTMGSTAAFIMGFSTIFISRGRRRRTWAVSCSTTRTTCGSAAAFSRSYSDSSSPARRSSTSSCATGDSTSIRVPRDMQALS
ncbi:MAG: hypothetical protein MZV70_28605 [Desulfobacterales bacterium]|nr:hypothetical protein [Desulfobacterales bacterium]